jgi:hypothetical protein
VSLGRDQGRGRLLRRRWSGSCRRRPSRRLGPGEVVLGGRALKNAFCFKYLGHLFYADGDHTQPVKARAAMAKAEFGRLSGFWRDAQVGMGLKLRVFKAGIVSVLAYGVEAWVLDQQTRRLLSPGLVLQMPAGDHRPDT